MFINEDYNFLRLKYWFGQVDSRPLGIFRIFFSVLMLKVTVYYLFIAGEFFSDRGVTPRALIWKISHDNRFSLLDFVSETSMAQIFFIIWIIILFLLLMGYRTREMLILNFIFIISTQARSFLILNGADLMMRVLSFWILFLPLGNAYSIDACLHTRRNPQNHAPATTFALPLRLIQLQVAFVYLFGFLLKLEGKPWRDGTALFYTFQVENHILPTGQWFIEHVPFSLLTIGTYFTLFVEGAFILLVFLPIFQPKLRAFALIMGIMMHTGIALLMSIHDFSMVMMISYLLFWDTKWLYKANENIVISNKLKLSPIKASLRLVTSLALIALMGGVFWWNLSSLKPNKQAIVPPVTGILKTTMQYLGLGQSWSMFSPYPAADIGWMSVQGFFEDGLTIDLMTGNPLSDNMTQYYWGPDIRWKKYSSEVWNSRSEDILRAWAEYYCRSYKEDQQLPVENQLVSLEIVYNWRWAHRPDAKMNPLEHSSLWQQNCLP